MKWLIGFYCSAVLLSLVEDKTSALAARPQIAAAATAAATGGFKGSAKEEELAPPAKTHDNDKTEDASDAKKQSGTEDTKETKEQGDGKGVTPSDIERVTPSGDESHQQLHQEAKERGKLREAWDVSPKDLTTRKRAMGATQRVAKVVNQLGQQAEIAGERGLAVEDHIEEYITHLASLKKNLKKIGDAHDEYAKNILSHFKEKNESRFNVFDTYDPKEGRKVYEKPPWQIWDHPIQRPK